MPHFSSSGNTDFLGIFGWSCSGAHKADKRRLWWVVFMRVLSFRAISGAEHGDRQRKSVCRKAEDMCCGVVMQDRKCWLWLPLCVCQSAVPTLWPCLQPGTKNVQCFGLCARPDGLPSLSCSLMSLSPSVYNLKAENREETAGGFIFNLFSRAARGEGCASLGRGGGWEAWLPAGAAPGAAGKPGHRGAHVRERPAPACRSAPPHVRPRGKGRHMAPPEHSALRPAPCISC